MTAARRYHGRRQAVRRRAPRPHLRRSRGRELTPLQRRRTLQLVVAGGIFVALSAMKLLAPQGLAGLAPAAREMLSQNADFKAAFSAVGEAIAGERPVGESLQDAYAAVFAPARYEAEQAAAVLEAARGITPPADKLGLRLASPADQERPTEAEGAPDTSAGSQALIHFDSAAPADVTFEQTVLGFDYATPVAGSLTSTFGYRDHPIHGDERFHYGLDIANAQGTDITAFADGTVKAAGESSSLGKYLMLAHANGITTLYAHCSKVVVASGEAVELGQKVAEMGDTGGTTGSHLHFEIMDGTTYLNPIYYVEVY